MQCVMKVSIQKHGPSMCKVVYICYTLTSENNQTKLIHWTTGCTRIFILKTFTVVVMRLVRYAAEEAYGCECRNCAKHIVRSTCAVQVDWTTL